METPTLATTIKTLTQAFDTTSTTPRLDAECLVAHVINQSRTHLFTYPEQILTSAQAETLTALAAKRLAGEPIAYLIGKQSFWTLDLIVTPATLIPRPETEHLIEWALTHLPETPLTIADLGTGSGAIACALASECPRWQFHATDLSAGALKIAQQNIEQNHLTNIECFRGSWCDALPNTHYDVIISNPPYIAINDPHLSALKYEPYAALVAEKNGFAAFEVIIDQAISRLHQDSFLIFEHGFAQQVQLTRMLTAAGFKKIEQHTDIAQQARFTVATHLET